MGRGDPEKNGTFADTDIEKDQMTDSTAPKRNRAFQRFVTMGNKRKDWLRGVDLNHRPLGYEPNELPDCSTPQIDNNRAFMKRSNRMHVLLIVPVSYTHTTRVSGKSFSRFVHRIGAGQAIEEPINPELQRKRR